MRVLLSRRPLKDCSVCLAKVVFGVADIVIIFVAHVVNSNNVLVVNENRYIQPVKFHACKL